MTRVHRLLLALALIGLGFGAYALWSEENAPEGPWTEGSVHGPWRTVFTGHGTVAGHDDVLTLSPAAATRPDETHAALVVSTAAYANVDYAARMRTVSQLRTPAPNPWEVPWLLWAYSDPEHFYYLTLKPNGWELGKRDPAYPGGQRFLATGQGSFPVGRTSAVRIAQRGARMEVAVDGRGLVAYQDQERPYGRGNVGMYTEDARVEFSEVSVRAVGG
ncbi:calcium-binding protein [Streptomyces luteireticuli]|uniref:Calcium-binding protein n=1 Tax=Streptomyces luteireticuli TaxID=173858 RepID=A0ABN0YSJ6_9ACTN